MLYKREIQQVLSSVLRAGNGQEITLSIPAPTDPMTGIKTGPDIEHKAPFAVVSYNREEIYDPSLANGLVKVLICPVTKDLEIIPDFVNIVENKNVTVILPDGKRFQILHNKTTKPDGSTPIVTRAFLGG